MPTSPRKRLRTARLAECSCAMGGALDSAEPVIRRVKVLGPKSRNGREYLPEAINRAAPLYEGKPVYFDHLPKTPEGAPPPDRTVISKFGYLENVRVEEGCLWGDLRYNPRHLYADTVLGWVQTRPDALGFSHNATGKIRENESGGFVVEEITEVESVDLVEDPATTSGLFESTSKPSPPSKVSEAMNPDDLLAPDDGSSSATPDAPDDGDDAEVQTLADKIGEVLAHIAKDDTLDGAAKLKKLKAAMKVLDDAAPDEEETPIPEEDEAADDAGDESDDKDDEKKAEESVKKLAGKAGARIVEALRKARSRVESFELREAQAKARSKARKLAESNLPARAVTDLFVSTLAEARDDDARKKLIEDRKAVLGVGKAPVSLGTRKVDVSKKLTPDDLLA